MTATEITRTDSMTRLSSRPKKISDPTKLIGQDSPDGLKLRRLVNKWSVSFRQIHTTGVLDRKDARQQFKAMTTTNEQNGSRQISDMSPTLFQSTFLQIPLLRFFLELVTPLSYFSQCPQTCGYPLLFIVELRPFSL